MLHPVTVTDLAAEVVALLTLSVALAVSWCEPPTPADQATE